MATSAPSGTQQVNPTTGAPNNPSTTDKFEIVPPYEVLLMQRQMRWTNLTHHREGTLSVALEEYKTRKDGVAHPDGESDEMGRWYPSEFETRSCCFRIKENELDKHCRSLVHVANLFEVDVRFLRYAYHKLSRRASHSRLTSQSRLPSQTVIGYKAVHIDRNDTIRSCFDWSEWQLNEWRVQEARENHGGGFYCYMRPEDAQTPALPRILLRPTHILRCEMGGNSIKYNNGKVAFSKCKPLEIIASILPYQTR